MTAVLDTTTPHGAVAAERFATDQVAWLTTVSADGTPQPNPIWFLLNNDESVLLFSKPGSARIKNIENRPRIALNPETGPEHNVIVLTGTAAVIDREQVTDVERKAYDEKYAAGFPAIGLTPESFHEAYAVAIRITPEKLRGW